MLPLSSRVINKLSCIEQLGFGSLTNLFIFVYLINESSSKPNIKQENFEHYNIRVYETRLKYIKYLYIYTYA